MQSGARWGQYGKHPAKVKHAIIIDTLQLNTVNTCIQPVIMVEPIK